MSSHIRTSDEVEQRAKRSHVDRIRNNYDTTNMAAIMDRFRSAVGGDGR